jgi:acetyl-CoA carboxylase carboxyltransferase component
MCQVLVGRAVATAICDVAEGLRSSVEIVNNVNMAIPYTAAERGFINAVIEPHQTRLLLRQCCGCSACAWLTHHSDPNGGGLGE